MKATVVFIALAVGFAVAPAHGEFVRADLSSAVDKDVIFESVDATSAIFGEHPEARQMFVVDGHDDGKATADGLPPNRVIDSANPDLGSYILQPYSGKNAIELASDRAAPAESHLVDLPNKKYERIGMIVSAVNGDTSFTIKFTYEDGTITILWWEADDWADTGKDLRPSQRAAVSDMDRINVSGQVEDSDHFSLFEIFLEPDAGKVLDSVTIGNDPNRSPDDQPRWGAVFAINAYSKGSQKR
jgi:hypothetical protein